jgi:hypothetical protein
MWQWVLTSKCRVQSESIASHAIPTNVAGAVSLGLLSSTGEWESLASAIGLGANLPLTTLGSVLVATFRASSPAYNCSSSRGLSLSNVPVYRQTLLTTAVQHTCGPSHTARQWTIFLTHSTEFLHIIITSAIIRTCTFLVSQTYQMFEQKLSILKEYTSL